MSSLIPYPISLISCLLEPPACNIVAFIWLCELAAHFWPKASDFRSASASGPAWKRGAIGEDLDPGVNTIRLKQTSWWLYLWSVSYLSAKRIGRRLSGRQVLRYHRIWQERRRTSKSKLRFETQRRQIYLVVPLLNCASAYPD